MMFMTSMTSWGSSINGLGGGGGGGGGGNVCVCVCVCVCVLQRSYLRFTELVKFGLH